MSCWENSIICDSSTRVKTPCQRRLKVRSFSAGSIFFWEKAESLGAVATDCALPYSGPKKQSLAEDRVLFSSQPVVLASALVSEIKQQLLLFSLSFCTLRWWYLLCYKVKNCLGGQCVLMEFCEGGGSDSQQTPWLHHLPSTFQKSCSRHGSECDSRVFSDVNCSSYACYAHFYFFFPYRKISSNTLWRLFLCREVEANTWKLFSLVDTGRAKEL